MENYEKLLEKAKTAHKNCVTCAERRRLESIFPELAESEDEKIRKTLLNEFIHLQSKGYKFAGLEGEDIVTWLEKQGENTNNKVKPKFKPGDTIRCKYDTRKFTIKTVDLEGGFYTYTQDGCGNDIDYADDVFELVEQKPTWSEEDEYQINTILHGLDLKRELYKKEGNQVEEKRYKTQYDWLKSLKDRVQSNLKQIE